MVAGWSSTMNDVLSVMFGYYLKPEGQEVLVARRKKKYVIFKEGICTCVGCQSIPQASSETLSTGKGILELR